jgi:Protein of unknown function (DUF3106)
MSGRSTIPASPTERRAERVRSGRSAVLAPLLSSTALLVCALSLTPLAHAQHGEARSAPPAPHYQNPRPPAAPSRSGYLQRPAPSPYGAAQRYQSARPAPYPSQLRNYPQRSPAAPPTPTRPLISAQPVAPAPGYAAPHSAPPGYGPPGQSASRTPYAPPAANVNRGNQQHLGGWLQSHSGESFASQEQSLRQEPGFSRLPQPQQQRLIDRLHQLDTMPAQRRERTLGRIENLERLSPDRRQQVRNSAQELSNMPEERKQQIRSAFRGLRDLPPQQRQQQLDSPAFRAQYNDHERQILGNLLSVEPYQPR